MAAVETSEGKLAFTCGENFRKRHVFSDIFAKTRNCHYFFAYGKLVTHVVYGMGEELLFWKLKNLNKLLVFEALFP